MKPVGLGNTGILIDYAQKSPQTLRITLLASMSLLEGGEGGSYGSSNYQPSSYAAWHTHNSIRTSTVVAAHTQLHHNST